MVGGPTGPTPHATRKEWRPGESAEPELQETPEAGKMDDRPIDENLKRKKTDAEIPGGEEDEHAATGEKWTRMR